MILFPHMYRKVSDSELNEVYSKLTNLMMCSNRGLRKFVRKLMKRFVGIRDSKIKLPSSIKLPTNGASGS